ncbi:MAG: peptidoglycan DD-metalloendopeptidase family protein [Ilumatobacteraceae bacterium]
MLSALALGVCLMLPSNATVVDPFRAPECARCAGNRGIEYALPPNSPVYSGLRGQVVYVGTVAGVQYVVVRASADARVRVTYGGLGDVVVVRGDVVRRSDVLGTAAALHVGVRVGEEYVDPLTLTHGANATGGGSVGAPAAPRYRVTLGRGTTVGCVRDP